MKKQSSVIIFIDCEGNLLLQERGSYSKGGEKHGYFGGNIKKGEKPKDALIRELKEELNYVPKKIKFWKKVSFLCTAEGKYNNFKVTVYIFVSPLTKRVEKAKVYEGEGLIKTTLDEELESENFTGGYEIILKEIKNHFAEVLELL
ncbi:NUDIX hydrolase [Patescibacteria group bacterium]|nr:NUDIX hydrolase [Patescibacteria group bacterium]